MHTHDAFVLLKNKTLLRAEISETLYRTECRENKNIAWTERLVDRALCHEKYRCRNKAYTHTQEISCPSLSSCFEKLVTSPSPQLDFSLARWFPLPARLAAFAPPASVRARAFSLDRFVTRRLSADDKIPTSALLHRDSWEPQLRYFTPLESFASSLCYKFNHFSFTISAIYRKFPSGRDTRKYEYEKVGEKICFRSSLLRE